MPEIVRFGVANSLSSLWRFQILVVIGLFTALKAIFAIIFLHVSLFKLIYPVCSFGSLERLEAI